MSGVTDALLASTLIAAENDVQTALSSLEPIFNRHKETAAELLSSSAAYATQIDEAKKQIAEYLALIASQPAHQRALKDAVLAFGEALSSLLLAEVLNQRGMSALAIDARSCVITDNEFGCAAPLMEETFAATRSVLLPFLETGSVPVMGGFVGSNKMNQTTTLGRGGSDYTAAIVGAL
jgi:aspartate kinase